MLIKTENCTGCGRCVRLCPFGALELVEEEARVLDNCNLCGACVPECEFDAMELSRPAPEDRDLSGYKGVWVFGELRRGELHKAGIELVGEGRKLADALGAELGVCVLGDSLGRVCAEIARYPVDVIYKVEAKDLSAPSAEVYGKVFSAAVREFKPEVVLAGATSFGRSFLSRVAVELQTGLTADCTGLEIGEDGLLLQTRPAFGGNIMATIKTPCHRPQMATVRPKVMKPASLDGRGARVVEFTPEPRLLTSRAKVLDFLEELEETANVADADIIVSGGRGLGGPENFSLIEELARALGGALGASRAAVDAGWIPYPHQVGQTGKTVQPKLYVAVGISGAVQHLVGMQSSDVIVAINKDRDAPIFSVATYGLVGDLFEVVPIITKKLKER